VDSDGFTGEKKTKKKSQQTKQTEKREKRAGHFKKGCSGRIGKKNGLQTGMKGGPKKKKTSGPVRERGEGASEPRAAHLQAAAQNAHN